MRWPKVHKRKLREESETRAKRNQRIIHGTEHRMRRSLIAGIAGQPALAGPLTRIAYIRIRMSNFLSGGEPVTHESF